jgi:uncharacterized protein YciW
LRAVLLTAVFGAELERTMRNARTAALLALAAGMTGLTGLERLTSTYTMPRQEPDNRGRRAEKDAVKLAKAEEKRKRRAAKRLASNK